MLLGLVMNRKSRTYEWRDENISETSITSNGEQEHAVVIDPIKKRNWTNILFNVFVIGGILWWIWAPVLAVMCIILVLWLS